MSERNSRGSVVKASDFHAVNLGLIPTRTNMSHWGHQMSIGQVASMSGKEFRTAYAS